MAVPRYTFKRSNLKVTITSPCASEFDTQLQQLWMQKQDQGLFRYKLQENSLPVRIPEGKFNFCLQLNINRAELRRKPQIVTSMKQKFNPDEFNFNKVKDGEILMALDDTSIEENQDNLLLINVSPLEYCHVLLTPSRSKNNPQAISYSGLRAAIQVALLSETCDLRVGFNSLGGYASVNHEHYHAYILHHRLHIEHVSLKAISDIPYLYETVEYPGQGFVFLLTNSNVNQVDQLVEKIVTLAEYLQEKDIAHNVFITRGASDSGKIGSFDALRIFFWVRRSNFDLKDCYGNNPAICELAGHFPCKDAEYFESLTEASIINLQESLCRETFTNLKKNLSEIFHSTDNEYGSSKCSS